MSIDEFLIQDVFYSRIVYITRLITDNSCRIFNIRPGLDVEVPSNLIRRIKCDDYAPEVRLFGLDVEFSTQLNSGCVGAESFHSGCHNSASSANK